jgi:hypothetical protein
MSIMYAHKDRYGEEYEGTELSSSLQFKAQT